VHDRASINQSAVKWRVYARSCIATASTPAASPPPSVLKLRTGAGRDQASRGPGSYSSSIEPSRHRASFTCIQLSSASPPAGTSVAGQDSRRRSVTRRRSGMHSPNCSAPKRPSRTDGEARRSRLGRREPGRVSERSVQARRSRPRCSVGAATGVCNRRSQRADETALCWSQRPTSLVPESSDLPGPMLSGEVVRLCPGSIAGAARRVFKPEIASRRATRADHAGTARASETAGGATTLPTRGLANAQHPWYPRAAICPAQCSPARSSVSVLVPSPGPRGGRETPLSLSVFSTQLRVRLARFLGWTNVVEHQPVT
jgi:hypothetical protein